MKPENQSTESVDSQMESTVPSADFIHAISEFFETDPSDLLAELGYYDRDQRSDYAAAASLAD